MLKTVKQLLKDWLWVNRPSYSHFVKGVDALALSELENRLTEQFRSKSSRPVGRFLPRIHIGLETRLPQDSSPYEWHGVRRSDRGGEQRVLFQYTLEGFGEFGRIGGRPHRLEPGMAFTAILPSAHVYRLPATSPGWRFFWIMIHHPYVVTRLAAGSARGVGCVWPVPPTGMLAASAATLWSAICSGTSADEWAQENTLFDFLFAHERHGHMLAHPATPRERLLAEVGAMAAKSWHNPPQVEALARNHGMSRSHFSHYFKAVTGQTPAAALLAARLSEVVRRLLGGDEKLAVLARDLGFPDATSLCRAFKRHYRVSPDRFRRRARGG